MKNILIVLFLVCALTQSIFAHEGHDKIPGNISAPHGGQIKGTSQLYIELVSETSTIKLYPMTHEMKPISLNEVKLNAHIKFPKKNKTQQLQLQTSENFFEAKVDSKGTHRYTLNLQITYNGKTEPISFNIEP